MLHGGHESGEQLPELELPPLPLGKPPPRGPPWDVLVPPKPIGWMNPEPAVDVVPLEVVPPAPTAPPFPLSSGTPSGSVGGAPPLSSMLVVPPALIEVSLPAAPGGAPAVPSPIPGGPASPGFGGSNPMTLAHAGAKTSAGINHTNVGRRICSESWPRAEFTSRVPSE